jgi:hypothetical protein
LKKKKPFSWFVSVFYTAAFFLLAIIAQYHLQNCGLSPFGVEGLLIAFYLFGGMYFYFKLFVEGKSV